MRRLEAGPGSIYTGRVTPVGDPRAVPATRDYEAEETMSADNFWAILPNNMAASRGALMGLGGFDERFDFAGEDLDLANRWFRSGGEVVFAPEMRAWHHDWRTPRQLRRTYVQYARGCGLFYAKNIRARDRRMAGLLRRDLSDLGKGVRDVLTRSGPPPWADDRLGAFPGLFIGLAQGWWRFREP